MRSRKKFPGPVAVPGDVVGQLAALITSIKPLGLCDGCLALDLHVSYAEARDAAVINSMRDVFERLLRPCHRCGRTVPVTTAL